MVEVVALQDIYSNIRHVERRQVNERFQCPDWVAKELASLDPPMVRILEDTPPKPNGALNAGPLEQRAFSLPVAPASRSNKSTMSVSRTRKAGAKR